MEENFECDLYPTEESTIKNCSNVEIQTIINKELGRGTYGVVSPVIVKFGSKEIVLILKKISKTFKTQKRRNNFIDDMYDEVDYSYTMGKNGIGPRVYDAFFYQEDDCINQYIIMEKFDTSVANWILSQSSKLTTNNCQKVTDQMLDLLHKQIFVLNTYCGDIKTDNFVVNFDPMIVKMIDFGIDWCDRSTLPNAYSKVKAIKSQSTDTKKEIFYCMCTIQLFMNILNIGTPLSIAKMILKPFYKDDIFIKYVLEDALQTQLRFEESKRMSRRSHKRNDKINFRKILIDILNYGHDQAILLEHYIRENNEMKNNEKIVDYVFSKIKQMAVIIFKK